MFPSYKRIKIEVNNTKISGISPNVWKLRSTLLYNLRNNRDVTRGIRRNFDLNKNIT